MIEVRDEPGEERYVVLVDGARAGFAQYVRRGGRVIFVHTEIDPAFEGQGLGGRLAQGALDHAREQGAPVVPLCPFIAGWLDKHEDYQDLVDREALRYLESGT